MRHKITWQFDDDFRVTRNSTLCERFLRSRVYPAKSGSGGALLRRHLTDLALTETL